MSEFLRKGMRVNLISALLFLVIGIVLVTIPETTLAVISYSIEMILIIWGIITIINYLRVESKYDVFGMGFVQGVICILIAVFLIINPLIITTILPICIGIFMIFGSLSRMQVAIRLNVWGQKPCRLNMFLAIVMFTVGLVIICNPFRTAAFIVQILGMGIIIYAVLDIIQSVGIIRFLDKMDM